MRFRRLGNPICIHRVQTLSLITGREGVASFWGEGDRSPWRMSGCLPHHWVTQPLDPPQRSSLDVCLHCERMREFPNSSIKDYGGVQVGMERERFDQVGPGFGFSGNNGPW